jgi:CPA1 family monovalent cation:H+ antiporter
VELFDFSAALLTLAALFAYANERWLKLPGVIGLMLMALVFSLGLIAAGSVFPAVAARATELVAAIDFNETLMQGMLGFLLFAGALHVNLNDLAQQKWLIAGLASAGVLISTAVVAALSWCLFRFVGLEVRFLYCLLFGALISPTDPIAVMALLKQAGTPKELELKIAGESLFNDGVGVVVFLGLWEIATGAHGFDLVHLSELFVQEALGGAALGWALGYLTYRMLRNIDNYSVEILLSLALAAGGYALAIAWHLSGPIAMVVAGLFLGNHGRTLAMSPQSSQRLDQFWELIDEILNALLFVLIGLEVLILRFTGQFFLAGLLAIPAVLAARWIAVGIPMGFLARWQQIHPQAHRILTWGGLRGGISLALALSIPAVARDGTPIPERDALLATTYIVVVFSILVQGLTMGRYVRRVLKSPTATTPAS